MSGGVYLLPELDDTLESFRWLEQEVKHAQGEALIMRISAFEGVSDVDIITLFHEARRPEYDELTAQVDSLLVSLPDEAPQERRLEALDSLEKLRKRQAEVLRRDYFKTPAGNELTAKLAQLSARLTESGTPAEAVEPVDPTEFKGKTWVTRPSPYVDRLASAWLIRRFIDTKAVIHYSDQIGVGEIGFDMPGAHFNHVGNLCTFEVLMASFGLAASGLRPLAEIVHDLDLQDGRYARPEVVGVEAVLSGWRQGSLDDAELEARGVALFEGLYQSRVVAETTPISSTFRTTKPKEKTRGRNR